MLKMISPWLRREWARIITQADYRTRVFCVIIQQASKANAPVCYLGDRGRTVVMTTQCLIYLRCSFRFYGGSIAQSLCSKPHHAAGSHTPSMQSFTEPHLLADEKNEPDQL